MAVEEVPDIARIKHEPNQEIVKRLGVLLEMAEKGLIESVAISGTLYGDQSINCFTSKRPWELLGVMEILRRDIVDMCMNTKCHKAGGIY